MRLKHVPAGFTSAVSALVKLLTGPLGELMLEDAAVEAKVNLEAITDDQVASFAQCLEREMPTDRVAAYRNGMTAILKQFKLTAQGVQP